MSDTPFIYLLNRMENAASAKDPSKAGYGGHRKAVLDHVAKAESDLAEALAVIRELLGAGDDCVNAIDDVAAMLRFGKAHDVARTLLAKHS